MSTARNHSLRETAGRLFAYMTEDHAGNWGLDFDQWDWVPGVGVIAIRDYYESTGRTDAMDFLVRWAEKNRGKAGGSRAVNAMAPFAVFPELHRHTSDVLYRDLALAAGEWLLREAPRTREGALEHTVTEAVQFAEQVWADTVFMAVLPLSEIAKSYGNRAFAEEALRQLLLHYRLLRDEESAVLFHGWNCAAGNHMSAARWTRANAWIALATPMILDNIRGLVPIPPEASDGYRRLIDGLLAFAQPSGLWPTVLDRSGFYPETSGSAGIAAGILRGVRSGWLEPSMRVHAERTIDAVTAAVDERGEVRGVSGGTPVLESVEAYNAIPQYPTLYGQGLALMLVSEALRGEGE
ncbi:MAG: glycosyl hydrolase [Cohnella sp.]|uniref:glycoside hydrolase family 88/105 protein n=1 Tax=Cohnella sp. TaxID=1883426 RepID=UPI000E3ACADB|nr:glycoside hydrolase family 88 protein [Cohnella sp.]REK68644.1 MAG: glycosyl hydrolase [Cohnella sp.]